MSRRQPVTYPYPPCAITAAYPILQRIPPAERAAWVAQAEAGIALTEEQRNALGLASSLSDIVLLPASLEDATDAQIQAIAWDDALYALQDIVALATTRHQAA